MRAFHTKLVTRRTTAVHKTANREQREDPRGSRVHKTANRGIGGASIILVGALGYSWGIRRIFGEYSWDIRMYRVCVGYVSVMCRLYVETDEERKKEEKVHFFGEKFGNVRGFLYLCRRKRETG